MLARERGEKPGVKQGHEKTGINRARNTRAFFPSVAAHPLDMCSLKCRVIDMDDLISKWWSVCFSANCMTSPWSDWTSCMVTCGKGLRQRSRMFKDPMGEKLCPDVALMEKEECDAGECRTETIECQVTAWSSWSPCSVTCGKSSLLWWESVGRGS